MKRSMALLGVAAGMVAMLSSSAVAQAQRTPEEIREESMLRDEIIPEVVVDLRGSRERLRDQVVIVHHERMAKLDHIAELVKRGSRETLLESVETLRRLEVRRFQQYMVKLRRTVLAERRAGVSLAPVEGVGEEIPTPGRIYADALEQARTHITLDGASAILSKLERRVRRELAELLDR